MNVERAMEKLPSEQSQRVKCKNCKSIRLQAHAHHFHQHTNVSRQIFSVNIFTDDLFWIGFSIFFVFHFHFLFFICLLPAQTISLCVHSFLVELF